MLSTNIFYSGYNILFGILSLFIGLASVFLIKDSKDFRGFLLFQLGGLMLILLTYITTRDYVLYKIGLNYNFVIFVQTLTSIIISVLWINSASALKNQRLANREALTVYMSLALTVCVYYSFIDYNQVNSLYLQTFFNLFGIFLLLHASLLKLWKNKNIGYFLFSLSLFMLGGKLIVSTFLYQYNWLNLNIFNWLWIYVFALAVVFIRFSIYKADLQKSWNIIDKINLQIINMLDTAPYPALIASVSDNKLLLINSKAADIFGITKKELSYHKLNDLLIDENNRKLFFNMLREKDVTDFDLMVCNLISGTPFWLSAYARKADYMDKDAYYITFRDFGNRKEKNNISVSLSDKDPLTNLWNRRYFEKLADSKIQQCIQNNQNFALLLLDADKFKKINDSYGHKIGDMVLIKLAEICSNSLRDDDIVARFGGEEFIIFLNDADRHAAERVAERLRQSIEDNFIKTPDDEIIKFTVSIGVVSSEHIASLDLLLRQVDEAMFLAKHNGRNQIALYDEKAVKTLMNKRKKTSKRDIHPVFANEETEEISLLDNYENKTF